jgi:cell wall-associated NlpC family hydrolase
MLKQWMPIPLLLLTISAHADSPRREPSLFLEYEREIKRSNEAQKDETPFQKLLTPIKVTTPIVSTPQNTKTIAATEPTPSKPILRDKEEIGADSVPFLVVNKPASKTCPEIKLADGQNEPKSLIKNLLTAKEKLLAKAKVFLGTPYGFGDKDNSHTDCSGFTQQVYRQFGVNLPHSAAEQAQLGETVSPNDLQVGDLLFYRTYKSEPSHVAIYAGGGQIIHASFNARKVQYDSIDKGYYQQRFLYAKRLAFNSNDDSGTE